MTSARASTLTLALRVVTGICMAGIYPVGMKLASTWAKGDMGLMVGILVGALTLGSAAPHLFNAFGGMQWRIPLITASASAVVAAVLIGFAGIFRLQPINELEGVIGHPRHRKSV